MIWKKVTGVGLWAWLRPVPFVFTLNGTDVRMIACRQLSCQVLCGGSIDACLLVIDNMSFSEWDALTLRSGGSIRNAEDILPNSHFLRQLCVQSLPT